MAKPKKRKGRQKTAAAAKAAPKLSFWDRMPTRRQHMVSLAVLLIIALGFFAPVNFQGKRIVGGDTMQSRAMAEGMVQFEQETGETALWSPNLFSGMPGFFISYRPVVYQADVLLRLLSRTAFPFPTSYFLLLLVGVYVLVFVLTQQSLASLLASIGAGLTTYIPIILAAGHGSKFIALAWIPWILIAFMYVLRKPGALSGLVFAAVLALGFRAGHVQIIYDAFFLIAIIWIVEGIGAIRVGNGKTFAISTVWLAVGTGLALLMVAQPYLAQYEFKRYSVRGGAGVPAEGVQSVASETGLAFDYAMGWSQGRLEMLTYLIADAFGGGNDGYWGDKLFTAGPHYLGGIIIALALVGVFGARKRTTTSIAVAVLVLTLFALGKNAAWFNRLFFDYFPLFDSFRAPEIWLHMVELGTVILAGFGAAWLVDRARTSRDRRVAWICFGGLFAFTILITLSAGTILPFEKPNERAQLSMMAAQQNRTTPDNPQVQAAVTRYLTQVKAQRKERFDSDAQRTAIVLGLALIGLFLFFSGRIPAVALLGLFALVVTIDLWSVGKRHLPSTDYFEGSVEDQIPEYAFDRFIEERVDEAGGPGHFRTLSLERSPTDWARPATYYENSGGYNAAKLTLYQDLINHLGLGGQGRMPNQTMLDLTATRYIVSRQPLPGTQPVFSDEATGLTVFERPASRWEARAVLVDSVVVVADGAAALEELKKPSFDRKKYAIARTDPGPLGSIDSSSVANVTLNAYSAHEIDWSVETDAQRLLVTSEIYYPAGWTATVDGKPTEILQVDHAFRGVVVPEGSHTVHMSFHPEAHFLGVWISLLATIFVYGAIVVIVGIQVLRRPRTDSSA